MGCNDFVSVFLSGENRFDIVVNAAEQWDDDILKTR